MITKPLSVDANVYEDYMIHKVFPAIRAKMGHAPGKCIRVQQDGARPHTAGGLVGRLEAAGSINGFTISIETQPAQSPDLNLCDLSIFASLQARQRQHWTASIDGLIETVLQVWEEYDWQTVERCWMTLCSVYTLILEHQGNNSFKLPHSGVRKLQYDDKMPDNAPVDATIVRAAVTYLRAQGRHEV